MNCVFLTRNRCVSATPIRALIASSRCGSATPGRPRWTGSVMPSARRAVSQDGDRVRVEAELRRHVAGEGGLGPQRLEQRRVGDEGVALRVGRDPDLGQRMTDLGHRAQERRARPGSRPAPWRRHRRRTRDRRRRPRARRSAPRGGRGRGSSAPRGAARRGSPWPGAARTGRRSPRSPSPATPSPTRSRRRGRNSAWSSAFLSGTSSNVGARRIPASAADRAGVSEERRRKSTRPRPRSPASPPCAGR